MLSLSSRRMPEGGTALFAALALGGDAGCTLGPLLVGAVAARAGLNRGLTSAVLFPIVLLVGARALGRMEKARG
jgi:hypothetical protein